MTVVLAAMAALLLAVAAYAQYRIPQHTARASSVLLARGLLIVLGLAFGYVCAAYYVGDVGDRSQAVLVFLAGFGAVHVPAAVILFVKRARGEGKS